MFFKHMTEDERRVSSLLWMGRFNILVSMLIAALTYERAGWGWMAVAMVAVYPSFLVYCWPVVRVRRTETVIIAAISAALGVSYLFIVRLGEIACKGSNWRPGGLEPPGLRHLLAQGYLSRTGFAGDHIATGGL